jgi:hypothetical protein
MKRKPSNWQSIGWKRRALLTVRTMRQAICPMGLSAALKSPGPCAPVLISIRDEQSLAILLIEHDMSVVMGISDHIVVLDYGRKISDGTPNHVKTDPAVIRAYLGVEDEQEEPVAQKLVAEGLRVHEKEGPAPRKPARRAASAAKKRTRK